MENHMATVHETLKKHKFFDCGKDFLLEWRLTKHVKVHTEPIKICKYFINNTECPFKELGCKFLHENSNNGRESGEDKDNEDDENVKEDNLCYFDFDDPKSLEKHTIQEHMDRFSRD